MPFGPLCLVVPSFFSGNIFYCYLRLSFLFSLSSSFATATSSPHPRLRLPPLHHNATIPPSLPPTPATVFIRRETLLYLPFSLSRLFVHLLVLRERGGRRERERDIRKGWNWPLAPRERGGRRYNCI